MSVDVSSLTSRFGFVGVSVKKLVASGCVASLLKTLNQDLLSVSVHVPFPFAVAPVTIRTLFFAGPDVISIVKSTRSAGVSGFRLDAAAFHPTRPWVPAVLNSILNTDEFAETL